MATGSELIVKLPAPQTQPRRLLDVLPRIPGVDGPPRWLNGVTWQPWGCHGLYVDTAVPCNEQDLDNAPMVCEAFVTQLPFRLADAMSGSTLEYTYDEIEAMLNGRYDVQVSAAFATELLDGVGSGGNSLSAAATEPGGAAFGAPAVPVPFGFAVLEEEIARRLDGAVGFIHASPGVLAMAIVGYGLEMVDGAWRTPSGNVVLSDAGYKNAVQPTNEAASSFGEEWVYASGPVFFESTAPTTLGSGSQTLDVTRNTITQFIEGFGILVFDDCPVTAVLVSYCNECTSGFVS